MHESGCFCFLESFWKIRVRSLLDGSNKKTKKNKTSWNRWSDLSNSSCYECIRTFSHHTELKQKRQFFLAFYRMSWTASNLKRSKSIVYNMPVNRTVVHVVLKKPFDVDTTKQLRFVDCTSLLKLYCPYPCAWRPSKGALMIASRDADNPVAVPSLAIYSFG